LTFVSLDRWDRELWDFHRQSLVPLMTIFEREDTLIVEVDLPLVRKEDIHLRLRNESLEVEASMHRCMRFERWGTVQRRCEFSSFYRVIPLPHAVISEGAKATFQKGILRIELQKKTEAKYPVPIE
jgi:HSP20 family protein